MVNIDRKFQWREQQLVCSGRTERDLYKWSLPPPCKPQLEMGVSIWYRPGLGAGTQGLEDSPGIRTVIDCMGTA